MVRHHYSRTLSLSSFHSYMMSRGRFKPLLSNISGTLWQPGLRRCVGRCFVPSFRSSNEIFLNVWGMSGWVGVRVVVGSSLKLQRNEIPSLRLNHENLFFFTWNSHSTQWLWGSDLCISVCVFFLDCADWMSGCSVVCIPVASCKTFLCCS